MKNAASAWAVAALLALVLAAPAGADTTLVGSWKLDEGAGTVAADSSGYGNNGTVEGAAQWVAGRFGTALSFDGSTGRVQAPDSSSLESASAISVSAWVKRAGSPGAFKYIVAKGAESCEAASYALYTGPGGGLIFYVSSNAGSSFTLSPDAGAGVWDGNWHHIAGTWDGSTVRLYVDGTQVGSGSPDTAPIGYGLLDSNDLFIAHYAGCAAHDFDGAIDQVHVWNRALSPADVLADMSPYAFQGFFAVGNLPATNAAKAGSAIPVKFSVGADFGLGILASGSPGSRQISCNTQAPVDVIQQTVTAGSSSLQYDSSSGQYTFVWKTDKAWAGTCRQLVVSLNDGSTHSATFQFK